MDNIFEIVDRLAKSWGKATVQILAEKENHDGVFEVLGTAFWITYDETIVLVTALHVLEAAKGGIRVCINNEFVSIRTAKYIGYKDDDIAVMFISQEVFDELTSATIFTIPIDDRKKGYTSLDRFFLMGYSKGKRNRINYRKRDFDYTQTNFSFSNPKNKVLSKTHISNPLAFHFEKGKTHTTDFEYRTPPTFKGNSGGPILEVVFNEKTGDFGVRFSGVFIGYHDKEKEVIAVRHEVLVELMNSIIHNWNHISATQLQI